MTPPYHVPIKSGVKPEGGWGFTNPDGSHTVALSIEAARKILLKKKLKEHWRSVVAQWVTRTPQKDWLPGAALLVGANPVAAAKAKVRYTPQFWGRRAWDFMHHYLAGEYDPEEFQRLLDIVTRMLDVQHNKATGCLECHAHWGEPKAPETREEARRWLWAKHNEVNRRSNTPLLTYEECSKIHRYDLD